MKSEIRTTMKRHRRRLPIPQWEFPFTPDTFNLIQETTLDGARLARDRAEAEEARRQPDSAQAPLFTPAPTDHE
jgi:hypothetical protein